MERLGLGRGYKANKRKDYAYSVLTRRTGKADIACSGLSQDAETSACNGSKINGTYIAHFVKYLTFIHEIWELL